MKRERFRRVLSTACALALCALALMTWSLFDPRPFPVIVAMTVGQVLGTIAFATFISVVVADLRTRYVVRGDEPTQNPGPES